MENLEIVRLNNLPIHDLQPLLEESREQGFKFIDRLVTEYQKEINQFNRIGEALFGVYNKQQLVAIGGLNIDPYANEATIARVRHVYVLSDWRRNGVGKQLVQTIIEEAKHQFCLLTLRTFNEQASEFYRAIGFQTEPKTENFTHHLELCESEEVSMLIGAKAITLAEKRLAEAHLSLDINVISNLLHPDYVILQPNGRLETKEEVLESYRTGERNWDKAQVDDLTVRMHGDTGIVFGRWQASGQNDGKQFDYVARFISVWIWHDERWQNIAYQSTEIL